MKKPIYALLFLLALFFLLPAQSAKAGVGNTDSGGSSLIDSGGGGGSDFGYDSGSSYSSYSSDSGSSNSSGGLLILVFLPFILTGLFKSKDSDDAESWADKTTEERAGRPIVNDSQSLSRIKELDPGFDEDRFISWSKEVYLKLQSAWTDKDWEAVRSLESDSLFKQHSSQLQEYIRSQTTNVLERVRVEDVKIKAFYENPQGYDSLVIILSSTLRDYIRDDESRQIIEGDPKKDLFTVYRMSFIRLHGSQTPLETEAAASDHCPNCGAPVTADASQCDYCGAVLKQKGSQWALDTYDVVDEIEFYT